MEVLGGKIDFVLHSVGMSPNVRKGKHYTDLDYDYFHKTLDISAMSLHKVLQTAMKMDAINASPLQSQKNEFALIKPTQLLLFGLSR